MTIEPVIIGNATLYLGDCMEILPTLPKVDSVITDPPYGIRMDKGMGAGGKGLGGYRIGVRRYAGDWDDARPDPSIFSAILNVSSVQIIWGGQFFADILPINGKWLWWDKCQTMPSYGDGELAWTSLNGTTPKKFVYSNNGIMAKEKDRVHPTQKPVALMHWCIDQAGYPLTIIDPFMGSGTTGVAAMQLGRQFIGIEKEPKYFDIACRRIEQAQQQEDMFIDKIANQQSEQLAIAI